MLREDFIKLMFGYFGQSSKTVFELSIGAKPDNITPIQYNILEYLYFSDRKNLSDISECMYLSMPNASREVKKLMEKDLVVSESDLKDRRKHYFYLTEAGKTLMEQAFQVIIENANKKYSQLSDDEQVELMTSMTAIMNKLFI